MPAGNKTGPEGKGPLSGKKLGYCAGYDSAGYETQSFGRMGRGFRNRRYHRSFLGFGRGFRRNYPENEINESDLRNEIQRFKDHISVLESRLKDLESKNAK